MRAALRARLARRLEAGTASPPVRAVAALWSTIAARQVARPLRLPRGVRVIGIGSAVLGGAGKTPLSIALAWELAARGGPVALIGHAYRACPERARIVEPGDAVAAVGDDALAAARLLVGSTARVIVAPDRQRAVDHAAALGFRLLVVDGLLQAAPERLAASVLVLDAGAPWGGGACPPAGDLRAPREALLAAADHVVALGSGDASEERADDGLRAAVRLRSSIEGAVAANGERWSIAAIAQRRVGLFVAIAHPERLVAALRRVGIEASPVIALADHAIPAAGDYAGAARFQVDAWLTSARCAVKLPHAIGRAPVLVLEHRIGIGPLIDRLQID